MFAYLSARFALPALSLSLLAFVPGSLSAQTVEWRGYAVVSGFTSACVEAGWAEGDMASTRVRIRPSGLGSNGNTTRISFFMDYYAMNFRTERGRLNRQWRTVNAGGLGGSFYPWPGTTRVRLTQFTPSLVQLNEATPHVRWVGEVQGIDGIPGCNMNFDATMLRAG